MRYVVDSSLVHKSSADQVLLVSAEQHGPGTLELGVGVPPGHPCTAGLPASSTLLGFELMRQCAIAYAHLAARVPQGCAFLMNELTFAWVGGFIPSAPEQFTGRVNVRECAVKMRQGQVSGLQLEADYISGGTVVGTGHGDLTCLPPRAYQAIRRNAPPVDNANTGPLGTVLDGGRQTECGLEARLVWNWGDRFIFDHPSDHVSGMLLVSAVLQAHLLLAGSQAGAVGLRCENFAEYNLPVDVAGTLEGPGQTRVTITQSGRIIASGLCGESKRTDAPGHSKNEFHRLLAPSA